MEIGYELKKRLPKARIRYVIDRDKFGYAEFGDYFFWVDNGLYVWHKDEEYEEDHNPDIVADYFGHDCKGRGYTCRHIFAGIDTGYDDCDGSRMFTGDIVQVKTSVQKNISVGFSIEESLNRAHLEEHVKGAYVFVYVDTSKAVWRFRYFIISRQQFIKLLFAAHDWYDNGYKREKPISKKSPAGMKIEWLEGKDEKETDRHIAFHNPLQGISCEDCWENIWKD